MEPKFKYNIKSSGKKCAYKIYKNKCRGNKKFAFCTRSNSFIINPDCTDVCSYCTDTIPFYSIVNRYFS